MARWLQVVTMLSAPLRDWLFHVTVHGNKRSTVGRT